jgi:GNAT superfamily N-acetyltransferase
MRIQFGKTRDSTAFRLEPLAASINLAGFSCRIEEYSEWLRGDALRSQDDHIARTWLLRERSTGKIASYMSLIMDAIKLSFTEKELHNLNYPFKTIPAMKIAKLAVDETVLARYKGLGSFMIKAAEEKAVSCNDDYCAARFLTVDADIEHDEGVLAFYEKNGFIPNAELFNKNRKTISMRKDLYR